jgi:hypothetical protein
MVVQYKDFLIFGWVDGLWREEGIYVGLKVCILEVREGPFSYSSSRMVRGSGFLNERKAAAAATQGSGAAYNMALAFMGRQQSCSQGWNNVF